MPTSTCGVWSAFWLLSGSKTWPEGGEIDILEGVNEETRNSVTLHTGEGCTIDNSTSSSSTSSSNSSEAREYLGDLVTPNCDVNAPGQGKNIGCSIKAPALAPSADFAVTNGAAGVNDATAQALPSFGTPFNAAGGGIYATEWNDDGISVWFFPRGSPAYTTYFSSNTTTSFFDATALHPSPSLWPPPLAHFPASSCDPSRHFTDLKIIFDTMFCGDWAGREWESSGCMAKTGVDTCEAYIAGHAGDFEGVFWEVGGLAWFKTGDAGGLGEGEREASGIREVGRNAGADVGGVKRRGRWMGW